MWWVWWVWWVPLPRIPRHLTSTVTPFPGSRWLEKRGGGTSRLGNKRYKKRWFELVKTTTGVFLTYQSEPGDGVLKGAIEMHSIWLQNVRRRTFKALFFIQSFALTHSRPLPLARQGPHPPPIYAPASPQAAEPLGYSAALRLLRCWSPWAGSTPAMRVGLFCSVTSTSECAV